MSQRQLLVLNLIITCSHVMSINAAGTYSNSQLNGQSYPLPIYPIQQQKPLTQQQQNQNQNQNQNQYVSQSTYQRDGRNFNFQYSYPYQPFTAENQRNKFAFVQPRTATSSYVQSQLFSPDGQLEHQFLPYWMGNPIVADNVSKQYLPETPYNDHIYYHSNQVSSPSSAQSSLMSFQSNSYRASSIPPAIDYAAHFERYLKKYPRRLRPTFQGNGLRK